MESNQDELRLRAESLASHIEQYVADPISYPGSSATTSSSTVQTEGGRATFSPELVPGHPLVTEASLFLDWLPADEVCEDEAGGKYFRHDPENSWYRCVNNSRHLATLGSGWLKAYAEKFAAFLRQHFGSNDNKGHSADGPIANGLRYGGKEFVGLNGQAWKLLNYLWAKGSNGASFDDVAEHVWGDSQRDGNEVKSKFRSPQSTANKFFRDNALPFEISASSNPHLKKLPE